MHYLKFFITLFLTNNLYSNYEALCTVPVANLFDPCFHTRFPELSDQEIKNWYHNHPLATVNKKDCFRIHQILFNEQVTILEECGIEVKITIKNAFYQNSFYKPKVSTYWTLKEYLTPLTEIDRTDLIPAPLNYKNKNSFKPAPETVFTLTQPTHSYSVRTRFAILETSKKTVTVAAYNPETNQTEQLVLDRSCGIINQQLSHDEQIAGMIQLLINWSTQKQVAPFARGGCSLYQKVTPEKYTTAFIQSPENTLMPIYYRQEQDPVYTGFDMPGMVLSACHIMHIPYCFKNSVTVQRSLRHFNPEHDTLEAGDLIVCHGYVGVVVNPQENTIIECRGYQYHEGSARCVQLSETFSGIADYNQLLELHAQKRPLTFIDNHGVQFLTTHFSVLKLKSVF